MTRLLGSIVVISTLCTAGGVIPFERLPAPDRARVCDTLDLRRGLADPALSKALRAQTIPSMGDIGDLALHVRFDAVIGPDGRIEEVDNLWSDVPSLARNLDRDLEAALVGARFTDGIGKRFRTRISLMYTPERSRHVWVVDDNDRTYCESRPPRPG